MHIRRLTALTALAAMGALAGCEGGGESYDTADETAYQQEDTAPAPESSTTPPADTGSETAGTEDPLGQESQDPFADQGAGTGTETADTTGEGTSTTTSGQETGTAGQDVQMTEFAALDTDSDGEITESEWQPDALEGMEFQDIDEDSDGAINRQEFRQAAATAGGQESGQSESDPTTP